MSGIVGIFKAHKLAEVERMLDAQKHRGPDGRAVLDLESDNVTLGLVWPSRQADLEQVLMEQKTARDSAGNGRFAELRVTGGGIAVSRDSLGAAPLYYGRTEDDALCFASEVKALLKVSRQVFEVPPGAASDLKHFDLPPVETPRPLLDDSPDKIAAELFKLLDRAVISCLAKGDAGSWLSGGLDSSVLCAILRPHVKTLHSFSVGMEGSSDLDYARRVAGALKTEHHELIVDKDGLLEIMPDAIYALESFDAPLVRSSMMNYLVGRLASQYVPAVLSGEAGDELFGGYDYLRDTELSDLHAELLDIQKRLHNTAFQRVDRCSAAHGLITYIPFADPEVVQYARRIPAPMLINDGVSKWILRHALKDKLPKDVLLRGKAKFWQGSGVNEIFVQHADDTISDAEYEREKRLPNGWVLSGKEELMYYRIFREKFGELPALYWMGRSKGTYEHLQNG